MRRFVNAINWGRERQFLLRVEIAEARSLSYSSRGRKAGVAYRTTVEIRVFLEMPSEQRQKNLRNLVEIRLCRSLQ